MDMPIIQLVGVKNMLLTDDGVTDNLQTRSRSFTFQKFTIISIVY